MKKERFIVEIEMPDGDYASPSWVKDVLQSDADIEDEGRWKVSVKECWKPSNEQMFDLKCAADSNSNVLLGQSLLSLYNNLRKLKEE